MYARICLADILNLTSGSHLSFSSIYGVSYGWAHFERDRRGNSHHNEVKSGWMIINAYCHCQGHDISFCHPRGEKRWLGNRIGEWGSWQKKIICLFHKQVFSISRGTEITRFLNTGLLWQKVKCTIYSWLFISVKQKVNIHQKNSIYACSICILYIRT